MCDLQHKTALHDRYSRSILITSVIIWYEVDEVAVETLQRSRASGASVHGELQPALLHRTSLAAQLVPPDVLDAADMPLLDRRMPVVAQPEGESSTSMSAWIRIVVLSVPLVQRRQCFSSSLRVMCCETSANAMPLPPSCTGLASLSKARSPASHSKMQVHIFGRKMEYRGWVSVV